MGKVDELMELVDNYGHLCRSNALGRRDEFDELRTALSACVAEWLPISEAPRDGTVVELANAHGTWYAKWCPIYASGFKADNPWFSLMLNCDHIAKKHRYKAPTHFRALLTPPTTETEGETK